MEDDLVEMYEEMKGDSDARSAIIVRNAMKESDIAMTRTTLAGNRHGYVYSVPGLFKVDTLVTEIEDEM